MISEMWTGVFICKMLIFYYIVFQFLLPYFIPMGLFGFFSKDTPQMENNKSHLKNLIAVAMSDGSLDINEAKALFSVASRLGINELSVREIVSNHTDIKFILPKERKDRIQQFWDLIMIILADGKVEEREIHIFENFASKLKIRKAIVAGLVRKFTEWTGKGEAIDSFK